jgi:hypothetical protein
MREKTKRKTSGDLLTAVKPDFKVGVNLYSGVQKIEKQKKESPLAGDLLLASRSDSAFMHILGLRHCSSNAVYRMHRSRTAWRFQVVLL